MTADTDRRQALLQAADAARYAPSVHNTQPWKWVVHPDRLALYAETGRELTPRDPDPYMLLLSGGAARPQAEVALGAAGWQSRIERPADVPLAVIHPEQRG